MPAVLVDLARVPLDDDLVHRHLGQGAPINKDRLLRDQGIRSCTSRRAGFQARSIRIAYDGAVKTIENPAAKVAELTSKFGKLAAARLSNAPAGESATAIPDGRSCRRR